MHAPICEVCLKSNILCSVCQEKLSRGETTEREIEVCRYLYGLEEKVKNLKEARILKVCDSNSLFIITAKGDAAKIVGRRGSIVKELAKKHNKPIRVVEFSDNFREFVENLLSPAVLTTISIMYTTDGETYKIIVPSSQKTRLFLLESDFSGIIKNLYGKEAQIVFE